MPTVDGNDGLLHFDDAIIGKVTSYRISREAAVHRTDGIGDAWETVDSGKKKWSATVSVRFDSSEAAQAAAVEGATGAAKFYHEGNASGKKYDTGNYVVESVEHDQNQDDRVARTLNLRGNGALSEATVV